ncbi:hypothetical protein NKJ46_34145 [Mesorhizobium sp. M0166]|uniref:hypothetical protein n=1 Tax=Mesorhizobium sp. M0166 TaxID=2956902 RepID=UPI003338B7C9
MYTLDQQTALKQGAREHLKESHTLGRDAGRSDHFHRGWDSCYDLGVADGHCGPFIAAELMAAVQTAYLARLRTAIKVLKAGCGTGPVGVELDSFGSGLIDGFDLCEETAEKTRQTRAYRNVRNLNGLPFDYSIAGYHLTVCCRVCTLGHVGLDKTSMGSSTYQDRVTFPPAFRGCDASCADSHC